MLIAVLFFFAFCALFQPLKKSGGIAEINGKTDSTITEVNYDREDEIAADGGCSQSVYYCSLKDSQHNFNRHITC